jgi:hypothetical protein
MWSNRPRIAAFAGLLSGRIHWTPYVGWAEFPSHLVQYAVDVVALVIHMEFTLDQIRNPRSRPVVGIISVLERTQLEHAEQVLAIAQLEPDGTARRKADLQSGIPMLITCMTPSHHRARGAPKSPADFMHREARVEKRQSATSPILNADSWPWRSSHAGLYSEGAVAIYRIPTIFRS